MIPTINMAKTGNRIKELMQSKNLSAYQLSKIMGFSNWNAVYKWIRGENLPNIDNLVILADLFEVSVEEILVIERGYENDKEKET